MTAVKTQRAVRTTTCGAKASTTTAALTMAISLLSLIGEVSSSAMPMAFAGGDIVATLKECGESPVRTVSCVGAQGSGKSTLMRSMFGGGEAPAGLALLEARSSAASVPGTNDFEVGAGQSMVSLAVSDATIYNVLVHDLNRPDALSEVQPALEELLALYEDGVVDPEQQKMLVIAIRDCEDGMEAELEEAVGERLKAVWAAAVKPEGFLDASLEDVLEVKVSCLPHHSFASDQYLLEVGKLKTSVTEGEAATSAAEVARLLQQVSSYAGPSTESVGGKALTAAFVAGAAAARGVSSFQSLVGRMGSAFTELNTDFGELCDGVVDTVLDEYQQAVKGVNGASGVLSRNQAELKRIMLRELGARHAAQMELVRKAARAKFDEALAGMRVSPDVGKQMGDAIQEADKFFAKTAKGMNSRYGSWPSNSVRKDLRDEMREFASERLQLVQAQGGMVNMKKRKPVGMAFHWFLPKPFGAEARRSRLAPSDPMRFTHKPSQSSPMFVDLAMPRRTHVEFPTNGEVKDTPIHEDVATLQRAAKDMVNGAADTDGFKGKIPTPPGA
eukprot:jgi/Undpi1/3931/HiC_scaffold_16.g07299.m1